MSKVFEDVFMEAQADMIALCCELTKNTVDGIYVYCTIEDNALQFDAFFTKQGKVLFPHELGVDESVQLRFLDIGVRDLEKIYKICKEHGHPAPTEMKLIYDVKTRKFGASYQYKPVKSDGVYFDDLMCAWAKEIDPTCRTWRE